MIYLYTFTTNLMILSMYQLYLEWYFLMNCTYHNPIFSQVRESTVYVIGTCLTPPYSFSVQYMQEPTDGYIVESIVLIFMLTIFMYHTAIGIRKIMIIFYYINCHGTDLYTMISSKIKYLPHTPTHHRTRTKISLCVYSDAKTVIMDNSVNTHVSNDIEVFEGDMRPYIHIKSCGIIGGSSSPEGIGTAKWSSGNGCDAYKKIVYV